MKVLYVNYAKSPLLLVFLEAWTALLCIIRNAVMNNVQVKLKDLDA